jgi:acyl-CoA thioester hydrolase
MLESYITKTEIDIQWGEMDAMQHLNNLVYLRYFESSRIRFFEQTMKTSITNKGVGIILAEISCKFKYPLTGAPPICPP